MSQIFTGRHMLMVMVAFFGVVVGVNLVMARLAISTFSGTVVDNSYVASQEFNTWLGEARAQRALGWKVAVDVDAGRHVVVTTRTGAYPVASVTAVASHPLGRIPDQALIFDAAGPGRFVSRAALPAGRFHVHVGVVAGGHVARFEDQVPA